MKKYVLYFDILGFDKIPEIIAKETNSDEDYIRQNILSIPFRNAIEGLRTNGVDITKAFSEIEGSDNYIVTCNELKTIFDIITKMTSIPIPNKLFNTIPLEIAIDIRDISTDIQLINQKEIIQFLKTGLITKYRRILTNSPKTTFILLSNAIYDQFDQFDKKLCKNIPSDGILFYSLEPQIFQHRYNITKFLEHIGKPDNIFYKRIDELYVFPKEYDDIVNSLAKNRIVFITGTKEYGKTYTAVRLLWEYYSRGYIPKWIGGEENEQRPITRDRLLQIENELQPKHIIYFEDPFGRTKYEGTETLEREIRRIVESVGKVEDVYVIITSREEVFKEFEREKLTELDLSKFERSLNIKKPSYDTEGRKKILQFYAEANNCVWRNNTNLANYVFSRLNSPQILPTPLSIRQFAISSNQTITKNELEDKIQTESNETAQSFAKEIEAMDDSKILFLSILLTSRWGFRTSSMENVYNAMVTQLRIQNPLHFDQIVEWFSKDKIEFHEYKISFSHPSYLESLNYLLEDAGHKTKFNTEFFSKVLQHLLTHGFELDFIADSLARSYDKLLPEIRDELLLKLNKSSDRFVHKNLADCIYNHFSIISSQLRDEIMIRISNTDIAAKILVPVVVNNEKEIGSTIREELLLKFARQMEPSEILASFMMYDPTKFSSDLFNKIADRFRYNNYAAVVIAEILNKKFSSIPKEHLIELLNKLSESTEFAGLAGKSILYNLKKIPEDISIKLLTKFCEEGKSSWFIARTLLHSFEEFPNELRLDLIGKLSNQKNDDTVIVLCKILSSRFTLIPPDLLSLTISRLAKHEQGPHYLTEMILANYDKLPSEIQSLIKDFARNELYRGDVVWEIAKNFKNLPKDVTDLIQNLKDELIILLENLADDDYSSKKIILEIIQNTFEKIELHNFKKILTKLSNDENNEISSTSKSLLQRINS